MLSRTGHSTRPNLIAQSAIFERPDRPRSGHPPLFTGAADFGRETTDSDVGDTPAVIDQARLSSVPQDIKFSRR